MNKTPRTLAFAAIGSLALAALAAPFLANAATQASRACTASESVSLEGVWVGRSVRFEVLNEFGQPIGDDYTRNKMTLLASGTAMSEFSFMSWATFRFLDDRYNPDHTIQASGAFSVTDAQQQPAMGTWTCAFNLDTGEPEATVVTFENYSRSNTGQLEDLFTLETARRTFVLRQLAGYPNILKTKTIVDHGTTYAQQIGAWFSNLQNPVSDPTAGTVFSVRSMRITTYDRASQSFAASDLATIDLMPEHAALCDPYAGPGATLTGPSCPP